MPAANTTRIDQADIDRANAVSLVGIAIERGLVLYKTGNEHVGPCPHCGGTDRFSINGGKQVFNCRGGCGDGKEKGRGAIAFAMWLYGCNFPRAVELLTGARGVKKIDVDAYTRPKKSAPDYAQSQLLKARRLWSHRQPITGSIAEKYLREARGISCPLPPTLAFLPPTKPGHHPAMISAFGLCDEIEPGIIAAPREIVAIHLTLLKPDGSWKIDAKPDKIMVGSPSGRPIVVAPPNDLLGLAITEGIEDALSAHQALGLGARAAGAAGFMPKLADAIPNWIDCVSIFADADADQQGERNAAKLAERLNARGIFAEVLSS